MLVNATEMLIKARDGHYGVPQFNINNLEWTKAVLTACEEMKSPVILGVSEGAGKYMTGFKTVAAMVSAMVDSMGITVPVALHLDHGTYEGCKACVEAGFSSIMFDGSHYSIEENVEKTKELVALAHSKGLSIEAEVGSIGGVEDGVVGAGEIADPAECAKITDLGIDFLAAGIGNIHGVYPANWKGLDFEALDRIHKATNNIPLVLHGGTGIPDEMIAKAIRLGVSKININTECQLVFAEATRKYIEEGKDQQGKGFDPRQAAGSRLSGHHRQVQGEDRAVRLRRQGLNPLAPPKNNTADPQRWNLQRGGAAFTPVLPTGHLFHNGQTGATERTHRSADSRWYRARPECGQKRSTQAPDAGVFRFHKAPEYRVP